MSKKNRFPDPQQKQSFPELEKEILEFWKKEKIFYKSIENRDKKNSFSFYDGPPFATGLPHYGHLLGGILKDVIPRYQTMCGKRVERRFGWDCHGLPVEFEKEKELGISGKSEIENLPEKEINGKKYSGVARFCEECRSIVLRYTEQWKEIVDRIGRFVDFNNIYRTMDLSYMESVFWVFSELYKSGLIYEGQKVLPFCTRCSTPLSNFEANQNYQQKQDPSVFVKFEIAEKTFILAWTTTPWTLPSNMALAVNPEIKYVKIECEKEFFILAKDLVEQVFNKKDFKIIDEFFGKDILGKSYKPLFDYFDKKDFKSRWTIVSADFVSTESGTGVVHIAPAFGEDDYDVSKKNDIGIENPVDENGKFIEKIKDFAGMQIFDANKIIILNLKEKNLLFGQKTFDHSYPFCWRCDNPLIYRGVLTWFVSVSKFRDKLLESNAKTKWMPEHIKDGRFGNWLENARDWAISRSRYWGTPIPVFKCFSCGSRSIVSSLDDLSQKLGSVDATFVRHGEWEGNVSGFVNSSLKGKSPLNKNGIKQAEELAGKMKDERFDFIIASPLERTKQTAEILAKKLSLKIIYDEKIMEWNFGDMDGASAKEIDEFLTAGIKTKPFPNGEDFFQMKKRMGKFNDYVVKKYKDKKILAVSHAGPIMAILNMYGKMSDFRCDEITAGRQPLPPNCSVHKIKLSDYERNFEQNVDLHKHFLDKKKFPCDNHEETKIIAIRHGETDWNKIHKIQGISNIPLNQNGENQAKIIAEKLKNEKFDLIITSPLNRAKKTAEIIFDFLGEKVHGGIKIEDDLIERNFGELDGTRMPETQEQKMKIRLSKPNGGESINDVEKRIKSVLKKYEGKKILIVAHWHILATLKIVCDNKSEREVMSEEIKNCDLFDFRYIPQFERVSDVFDCWFESGSVPYASKHYPFENKTVDNKPVDFPADFIAEGLDQTRGWFYTLTVLSSALFEKPAFKNVIVNGIILAEDGMKMSKSKKNYPDPMTIVQKYCADAMRIYLLSSPAVHGDSLCFSEKGVEEKFRKVILSLWNSFSFFCIYANIDDFEPKMDLKPQKKISELDLWIKSEMNIFIKNLRDDMDNFRLSSASKRFEIFLDKLNNFYIRRSRRRFWKSENDDDKNQAYQTLYEILIKFSVCLAPFCPFVADYIFKSLSGKKSVHLENFVNVDENEIDEKLSKKIEIIRTIISLGLFARSRAKIKTRTPINSIEYFMNNFSLDDNDKKIIAEELNVKNIIEVIDDTNFEKNVKINAKVIGKKFGRKTKEIIIASKKGEFEIVDGNTIKICDEILSLDKNEFEIFYSSKNDNNQVFFEKGILVSIDENITEELKQEGIMRDIIRQIQNLRKEKNLQVDARIKILFKTKSDYISEIIEKYKKNICTETLCDEIHTGESENFSVVRIDGVEIFLKFV